MSPSGSSVSTHDQDRFRNRSWPVPAVVILLLFLGLISFACVILVYPLLIEKSSSLEVSLHSSLFADYRADLSPMQIPPAGIGLVEELIMDNNPEEAQDRAATLVAGLLTPVPTVTGWPGQLILLPHETTTPAGATEPAPPPPTKGPVASLIPTEAIDLAGTATPTWTPTSRQTMIIPSSTPTRQPPMIIPTRTPTKEPTHTITAPKPSLTPTYPPTPTRTSTPQPTYTQGPYLPPATPYP